MTALRLRTDHPSDLSELLTHYADILPQLERDEILKKVSLITAKKTIISDLSEDAKRYEICLTQRDMQEIKEDQENLDASVSCFTSDILKLLDRCRSGSDDISRTNRFCAEEAKALVNRFPLEKYQLIKQKLDLYEKLRQHNVLYIGRITESAIMNFTDDEETFALYYYETAGKANPQEWLALVQTFFSLINQTRGTAGGSTKFIFVDCELSNQTDPEGTKVNIIVRYKHGVPVYDDSEDSVAEGQIPLAKAGVKPEQSVDAKQRGDVQLPCPKSQDAERCSKDIYHTWKCFQCQRPLEYGFDGHFYCKCGRSLVESFSFHCGQPKHGSEYVNFPANTIQPLINNIRPLKNINILILGETGVGKSTWINGFVNFVTYTTLEEALRDPVYLIPAVFTMLDEDSEMRTVAMGQSENENTTPGQSCTQMPKTYVFRKDDTIVRLIDTPGIGDTRGTDQDKKNFQFILNHLANYEDLHGICILLKPNNARLNVMFQFCIKELLAHLHRDACKNIVFVFTNARSTFYRPGDTYQSLQQLIRDTKDLNVTLTKDTVYCVDNEAVRFMAALKTGISFSEKEQEVFKTSWVTSATETDRFFKYVTTKSPHVLYQTLSLNEARRRILLCTEPLAHITRNLQINIQAAEDRAVEVRQMKESQNDLKKQPKLYVPHTDLCSTPLNYPRTVCAAKSCIKMVGDKENYVTWCHEHCYLTNIEPGKYPQPGLKGCTAMQSSSTCAKCKCSWEMHMHVTYEVTEVQTQIVDPKIEKLLQERDGIIKAVEAHVQQLSNRKDKLKYEMDEITKVASKCGYFLKKNAIIPHNDALEEYLRYLMKAEEEKIAVGASRKNLDNYQATLKKYQEEKKILEEALGDGSTESQITTSDIDAAILSLFQLPVSGQTIKNLVETKEIAEGKQMVQSETVYRPKLQNKKSLLQTGFEFMRNIGSKKGTKGAKPAGSNRVQFAYPDVPSACGPRSSAKSYANNYASESITPWSNGSTAIQQVKLPKDTVAQHGPSSSAVKQQDGGIRTSINDTAKERDKFIISDKESQASADTKPLTRYDVAEKTASALETVPTSHHIVQVKGLPPKAVEQQTKPTAVSASVSITAMPLKPYQSPREHMGNDSAKVESVAGESNSMQIRKYIPSKE